MTLFRVFTDQETTKAYHFIFGNVFNLVERCIGKKIKFHYLHGSGIRSIITDMCPKQMTGKYYTFYYYYYSNLLVLGLGKMLQETDQKTNNRDLGWRWHTMNVLIFCKIHFIRTINKLVPASRDPEDLSHIEGRSRLASLMDCKSRQNY